MTTLGSGTLGSGTLGDPLSDPNQRPNNLLLWLEVDSSASPKAQGAVAAWTRITHGNATPSRNGILAVDIDRGQEERYSPCEPGEFIITTDNANGHHDPDNPLSGGANPYAGLLTQGRQFRLRQTRNDGLGDQTVCSGTIDNVEALDNDLNPTAQFTCSDVIASAGTALLPPSLVEWELLLGARYPVPTDGWTLKERVAGFDTQFANIRPDGPVAVPVGFVPEAAGEQVMPYADWDGLKGSGGMQTGYVEVRDRTTLPMSEDWTIAVVGKVPKDSEFVGIYAGSTSLKNTRGVDEIVVDAADVELALGAYQLFANRTYSSVNLWLKRASGIPEKVELVGAAGNDGVPHLFHASVSQSLFARVGLDKTQVSQALTDFFQGLNYNIRLNVGEPSSATSLALIWRGEALSQTQMNLLYDDIFAPWAGDIISARIDKLVNIVMPDAPRSLATSPHVCLPVAMKGLPLLELLRRLAEAEQGQLWADRSNTLRFDAGQVGTASLRTYGGDVPVSNIQRSKAQPVTHCVVENEAGSRVQYHDEAASERIGHYRLEILGCPLRNPSDMSALAQQVVAERSTDTGMYTSSFEIEAQFPIVGYDDTLAMEPYDNVSLIRRNRWAGEVLEELQIIGFHHAAANVSEEGSSWRTTVRTQPA